MQGGLGLPPLAAVTRIVGVVAVVVMMAASAAKAEEPKGWKFEITPYAWLAGIEGDMTVNGHTAEFKKSFSDLFDYVDWGGSLLGVAQYNRYLAWVQADYFSLRTGKLDVDQQPQHGRLDSKLFLGEYAVGYQVDGWAEGQTIDLLVGGRTLRVENTLEVYGVGTFSKNKNVTDPIFVMRPSIPLFPSKITGLRFNSTLGIGGGVDSDLIWELQPQFQYQFTDHIAGRLGYRTVHYKFSKDGNQLNIDLSGLIVGIGVLF